LSPQLLRVVYTERIDMADEPGKLTDQISQGHRPESIQLFQVVALDGAEQRWRATGGKLAIGSHGRNDVVLTEPTVSRYHCELHASSQGVWVTDLESRNGTLVEGVRVKEAMVKHGDVLCLGRARLRFEQLTERESLELSPRASFGPLVGSSLAMRTVFATLERTSKTDATVLLEGETGTGKGAIAEAIHAASPRHDGAFVVVDCGALAPSLLESELFGHERGAFTGADSRRIGAFEEASGGTIFLDEIGEFPPEMQPKLLRVLENRTVRRLGQNVYHPVDVRVIAATHRDLRSLVNEGRFRADLYYRLAVVRIRVPSLRERLTDLPELVAGLLRGLGSDATQLARLTKPDVIHRLESSAWPGNVRELRNYLERSLVLDHAAPIDAPGDESTVELPEARRRALDAFERRYLEELLSRHGGKVAAAARAAGVARVYLYRLLGKHGLKPRGASQD
jgi:two-component system, NtrC family, response regulator GlrR